MTQYAIPDESLTALLEAWVSRAYTADEPLRLRLFVNDVVPLRSATLATFTEATFTGYTERVIQRGDWGAAVLGLDHVARIKLAAGPQEWNPTGALQTVYGIILVNAAGDAVRYAVRFATPRVLAVGVPLLVNPVITMRSASLD